MTVQPDGADAPVPELEGRIDKPEGPIKAALLAVGIGAFTLGLLTTCAEANEAVKDFLDFYGPVGPLSGKTTVTVVVWLVVWGVLHLAYRKQEVESRKALAVSLVLIGLGLLGTFPVFFTAFAP
ncbi:hypothetical protein AB0K52_12555 [Glycomyces sp. NPDC049804]|uniref:hypothetical protein n=1 Tax=Glycomyces sp. NPDC049804 TaxID=3154363 RepID=UPI00343CD534